MQRRHRRAQATGGRDSVIFYAADEPVSMKSRHEAGGIAGLTRN